VVERGRGGRADGEGRERPSGGKGERGVEIQKKRALKDGKAGREGVMWERG